MKLNQWLAEERLVVESGLERFLPERQTTDDVYEAMRYSLFAGGKRLRPLLALLTGEAIGFSAEKSLPYACALEMVHTYSLIHDYLPAMDNDSLRWGRPTCHIVYGEATAMLAGDAMLTLAFEVLGEAYRDLPAPRLADALRTFARALGASGMVGGQSRDLKAEGRIVSIEELRAIHAGKTGALIEASMTGVGYLAGCPETVMADLSKFGACLGLAFQIKDDLLDIESSSEVLGKTAGKDIAQDKATYPRLLGLDGARQMLAATTAEAVALSARLPGNPTRFAELAHWAAERDN